MKAVTILYGLAYEFYLLKKLFGFDWAYDNALLVYLTWIMGVLIYWRIKEDRKIRVAPVIRNRNDFKISFKVSEEELEVFEFYWTYKFGEVDYKLIGKKLCELNTTVSEMNLYFANQILNNPAVQGSTIS